VEGTSTSLSLSRTSLIKGHEQSEAFSVTVSPTVKGNKPTGTVALMKGSQLLCTANLSPVARSKAVTYHGSCSLSPTALPKGTSAVTANYQGAGDLAPSDSPVRTISVST
jgi:hypothetical protein